MASKKKRREYHLTAYLRKGIFYFYVLAGLFFALALAMLIIHMVSEKNSFIFFYLGFTFILVASLIAAIGLFLIPNEVTKIVNTELTSDLMMVGNNISTSKDPIIIEKSNIAEFNDVKKRIVDVFNSFRDVMIVDRNIDDSYLKFGKEYGYADLITRDSFIYNLPFLLKLNAYSRGGLILVKINSDDPSKEAMNALADKVRKIFSTKVYLGIYAANTIIGYVTDVESLPVFTSLLYKLYSSYSFAEESTHDKIKIYSITIGASVYPYSLKNSLISDALQALLSSKDVKVFMPSSLNYGLVGNSSVDDRHRKSTLITDKLISFLYQYREGGEKANTAIGTSIQELADIIGFEGCGLITRPLNSSPADTFSCLRESSSTSSALFVNRTDIEIDELRPLIKEMDQGSCFYSTRREDLGPEQAAFFDKYGLSALFISFFGHNGRIYGATYYFSRAKIPSLSTVDTEIVKMSLMVLNYLGMNLLESSNAKLLDNDLEKVLKLDGRLRYTVIPQDFILLDVSDSIKDLLNISSLRTKGKSIKCYKALFNRDSTCVGCPFAKGERNDKPFDFAKGQYTRRVLTVNEQTSLAATMLMEPYINEKDTEREVRFDPETFLSSRTSFNELIENIFISKERGSLLFIAMEGVSNVVAEHGESVLGSLLVEVSHRIEEADVSDKIYRYDDGILAIYFPELTRIQMYDIIENIADSILKPYSLAGEKYYLHFKFGEYNTMGNYTSSADIYSFISRGMIQMRKADHDMLVILGEDIERVASKKTYIVNLLESNYSNRAVDSRLQPIVSVKNNAIVSAEILLRLYDALREKMLSPREVVTIATEAKKMGKFDSLNYRTANNLYQRYGSGVFRLYNFHGFSINLSSDSLESKEWLMAMKRFLDANRAPDYFLGFEIPEDYFPKYTGMIEVWHKELNIYRLNWEVDNYRNAKISPHRLSELGFSVVKFSRGFLLDAMSDPVSRGLYNSLIRDCHYNGIKVVAQGIETKTQFEFVKNAGADEVQGFYFYQPLKEDEFVAAISEHHEQDEKKEEKENREGEATDSKENDRKKLSSKEKKELRKQKKLDKAAKKALKRSKKGQQLQ